MKIPVVSRIAEWAKYERLHHYPALQTFDRDEALKRLKAHEREERAACQGWLNVANILLVLLPFAWGAWALYDRFTAHLCTLVLFVPTWALQYALHRRIRRRVEAKVAAELRDGRLWTCIECGYDLRASPGPLCPECGGRITVGPTSDS
jgi:hypothetical protein